MKKLVFVIVLAFFTLGIQAQKTYVLLTGVSNYEGTQNDLGGTIRDVKSIQKIFEEQKAIVGVLTGKNVTLQNIETKLNAIVQLAKAEDNIIFYYAGHAGDGALASYDEDITYDALAEMLSKAKTQKVFCFIDACESGSAASAAMKEMTDKKVEFNTNITFIAATRFNEYAGEDEWVGHGYFTQALIKGLRGKADTNRDRKVTLIELFKYVYNDVTARTSKMKRSQHPQLIGPSSLYDTVITKW